MKQSLKPILIGLALFACYLQPLFSQDLHFTNNQIIPTFINAAQTGAYAGNYRAGLIYRDQWRSGVSDPYQQAAVFVDSPFMFGLNKQQWIGGGITMFYDRGGAPTQTWSGLYPSLSYHISFDKKYRNVFTIGAQYGMASRKYSDKNWTSEDEELGLVVSSPDRGRIQDLNANYGDLNISLLFKSKIDKFSRFEIGGSVQHLLKPKLKFSAGSSGESAGQSFVARRINIHSAYRRAVSPQMVWEPAIYASIATGSQNIQIQLRNEYLLKKGGDISIISGLGFRFGDALQLLLGAHYKDYLFMFSYDQSAGAFGNDLAASAFEFGVMKHFVVNKKPKVKPIIYCPRL